MMKRREETALAPKFPIPRSPPFFAGLVTGLKGRSAAEAGKSEMLILSGPSPYKYPTAACGGVRLCFPWLDYLAPM
ncbi:MAG: hypothetical protein JW882_11215 [Deltaproteobacteria bacterium]|nr:hypothetical protein [Deltaproteobacteria bacterium]